MPTYFVFKPVVTTEQRRQELKNVPEYQELDKDGKPRWASFNYELACAEMCGQGHFSMRKIVKIVSQEEYDKWVNDQKSYYTQNIQGKEEDTFGKTEVKPTTEEHKGEHTDVTKSATKPLSMNGQ